MTVIVSALVFILAPSNISASGVASNAFPTLYGMRDHHPMVSGDAILIWPPGGRPIQRGDDWTRYVLDDHLGSGRIVLGSDVATPVEYGPYGEPSHQNEAAAYTGQSFDAAIRTYHFPARPYDPSTSRFIGPDPAGTPSSPYPYAAGDPISLVDPDGRAPVHFLFFSRFGTELPDHTGTPSIRASVLGLVGLFRRSASSPIMSIAMDAETPLDMSRVEIQDSHLTIIAHGLPGIITTVNPSTGLRRDLTGEEFAPFLDLSIRRRTGDAAEHIVRNTRSISILSCYGACQVPEGASQPPERSFIDAFVHEAPPYFPGLREVVASPYLVSTAPGRERSHWNVFELNTMRPNGESLGRYIDAEHFFTGRYPDDLFGPFTQTTFDNVTETWPASYGPPGRYKYNVSHDQGRVQNFIGRFGHEFSEPALRRVPIVPLGGLEE